MVVAVWYANNARILAEQRRSGASKKRKARQVEALAQEMKNRSESPRPRVNGMRVRFSLPANAAAGICIKLALPRTRGRACFTLVPVATNAVFIYQSLQPPKKYVETDVLFIIFF